MEPQSKKIGEDPSKEIKASLEALTTQTVRSMVSARDRMERDIHHNRVPDADVETEFLMNRFLSSLASSVQPVGEQTWVEALFSAIYVCEERLRQITDYKMYAGPVQRAQKEIEISAIANFMTFARRYF